VSRSLQSSGQTLPSGPPGCANSSTRIVQSSQSPAFAALFALRGRVRTRTFRQLTEDGTVADHQQYYVQLAVATGKFTHQVRWSWHQKSIFARISCLFGLRGNYSSVAGRDSWWHLALGGYHPLLDESAESLKGRWEASYDPAASDQSATKQS